MVLSSVGKSLDLHAWQQFWPTYCRLYYLAVCSTPHGLLYVTARPIKAIFAEVAMDSNF